MNLPMLVLRFQREFGFNSAMRARDGLADTFGGKLDVAAALGAGAFEKLVQAHRSGPAAQLRETLRSPDSS